MGKAPWARTRGTGLCLLRLVVWLGLLSACHPVYDRTEAWVTVTGLPAAAARLRVQTRLAFQGGRSPADLGPCVIDGADPDGVSAWTVMLASRGAFALLLNAVCPGSIMASLVVEALDGSGDDYCIIARGQAAAPFAGGERQVSLQVALLPLERRECTLRVVRRGTGSAEFTAQGQAGASQGPRPLQGDPCATQGPRPGACCGEDCGTFAVGSAVLLRAQPQAGSYLWAWSALKNVAAAPPCQGEDCALTMAAGPAQITATLGEQHCAGGWCWEHPLPTGNQLNAVWAGPTSRVNPDPVLFAVGDAGTLLRHDGEQWQVHPLGSRLDLRAITCDGASRCWAAGDQDALYCGTNRDGRKDWDWSPCTSVSRTSGALYGLSQVGDGATASVLAVGSEGRVQRWDPQQQYWSLLETIPGAGELRAIHSVSAQLHYAVDLDGKIFRKKDGAWGQIGASMSGPLLAVRGDGRGAVWAAGAGGAVLKITMDGNGNAQVMALPSFTRDTLFALALDGSQLVLAGSGGVYRYDLERGGAPVVVPRLPLEPTLAVRGAAGAADGVTLVGSAGGIWRSGPAGFQAQTRRLSAARLTGVLTLPAEDAGGAGAPPAAATVLAVGADQQVLQRSSGAWRALGRCAAPIAAVFGDRQHLWGLSQGAIFELQRSAAEPLRCALAFSGDRQLLAGRAHPGGARVVGEGGTLLTLVGTRWTAQRLLPAVDLFALWDDPGGDSWLVGGQGLLFRQARGQGAFVTESTNLAVPLLGLSRSLDREPPLVAVGPTGLYRRRSAGAWEAPGGCAADLHAVSGSATRAAVAVGAKGTVLRVQAEGCVAMGASVAARLYDVTGDDRGALYAVGDDGAILRYQTP